MRGLAFVLLAVAALVPAAGGAQLPGSPEPAVDHCGPPCGPIPVDVAIFLESSRRVTFTNGTFESKGRMEYSFDIDQNGVAYDPQKKMYARFTVGRVPPWTNGSIEPAQIEIPITPVQCPPEGPAMSTGCYQADSADHVQYFFRASLTATVKKLREPTMEELRKWVRSDGTYRFYFEVNVDGSLLGTTGTGEPVGLYDGYTTKEIRFLPEWSTAVDDASDSTQKDAPAAGLTGTVGAFVIVAAAVARRRP